MPKIGGGSPSLGRTLLALPSARARQQSPAPPLSSLPCTGSRRLLRQPLRKISAGRPAVPVSELAWYPRFPPLQAPYRSTQHMVRFLLLHFLIGCQPLLSLLACLAQVTRTGRHCCSARWPTTKRVGGRGSMFLRILRTRLPLVIISSSLFLPSDNNKDSSAH